MPERGEKVLRDFISSRFAHARLSAKSFGIFQSRNGQALMVFSDGAVSKAMQPFLDSPGNATARCMAVSMENRPIIFS